MADVVQDIKDRIDIVTLTSQYLQLKKAGRNYKACCPFHGEKTASFVVSPEKQIFHCFGCHKGGDIFTFLEEIEGLGFAEAMSVLADRAGVKIDKEVMAKSGKSKDLKEKFFELHELALKFFEDKLHHTKDGEKVLAYLKNRGLDDQTVKDFRLGFGPDSYNELHDYLLKEKIPKDLLLQTGLVSSKKIGDSDIYDKYRARLIFPIFDYLGRICGFAARALKKEQSPKYLNSPDTPVYNKSAILYGLSHAKQEIKNKDSVILVEGYFDMILPYQAGVKNIVATSGTALTSDHVRILKRLTANVVSYFDTDNAGFEATKRAYNLLQHEEMFMKMVTPKDDLKDPADYVKEHGADIIQLIDDSEDFIIFYIARLLKQFDKNSAQGRRQIFKDLLPIYKGMLPGNRDFYVRELSRALGVGERTIYDEIDHFDLPNDHPARTQGQKTDNNIVVPKFGIEELICGILIENPEMFESISSKLKFEDFEGEMKDVYKALYEQYNASRGEVIKWDLGGDFLALFKDKIAFLSLFIEEKYQAISGGGLVLELEQLIKKMNQQRKAKNLNQIQAQISEAEKANNKEKLLSLLSIQQELLNN